MLKKIRSLSKTSLNSSSDKKDKKKEKKKKEDKKKKSNQKVNQGSQTDETSSATKQNVNKRLDFEKLTIDKSKMDENNKTMDSLLPNVIVGGQLKPPIQFIDDGDSDYETQDKSIDEKPLELPSTVKTLESENGSKVYLIGTAHFSEESCKDVETVINKVKPDVVVLELCQERVGTLLLDEDVLMEKIMNFTLNQAHDIIKSYGLMQGIIQILFLYVSKEITKQTQMLPGSEIRTAFKEIKKIPHCSYKLGDRPFHITFRRAIGSLTVYQKFKLAFSVMFSKPPMSKEEVETFKQNDILEGYLDELQANYPMMKKALVDERDMYLAYQLQCACTSTPRNKNEFYTERLKVSRNSLANVQQHLNNCKHELDNLKKIKSLNSPDQNADSEIDKYSQKLQRLEKLYNIAHQQVIRDAENLDAFSRSTNDPTVVVGIVGMGHINGIVQYFNQRLYTDDIEPILILPQPSKSSIIIRKVFKYSFYGLLIYGVFRKIPNAKETIVELSSKSIALSKEFINDRLIKK